MKIRSVGDEFLMRTDGLADKHDKANSRISQFCEHA
jgi:hypothetical protein